MERKKIKQPGPSGFVPNVFPNKNSLLNCINSAAKQDLAQQNRLHECTRQCKLPNFMLQRLKAKKVPGVQMNYSGKDSHSKQLGMSSNLKCLINLNAKRYHVALAVTFFRHKKPFCFYLFMHASSCDSCLLKKPMKQASWLATRPISSQ